MAGESAGIKARLGPPNWAEHLLERLLTPELRETVTGDLREEYVETVLPLTGRLRADLWYLRQLLSFVARCASAQGSARRMLLATCLLTWLCGCWLATMESLL